MRSSSPYVRRVPRQACAVTHDLPLPTVPPLAAVAHELRTPLGGILGCAELLASTMLDAEQRAHLDALREAAEALARFADDALECARLGLVAPHANVRPAPCDARELLAGVTRTLAPSVARRGLTLAVAVADDVPLTLCIDAGAVRRILLNLGANALRATRRGGVRLTATCDATGTLVCAVADTGVGMTTAQQTRLFRAWESRGGEDGVGLGLVLAAELATRMGGTLTVESSPGHGSTFYLRIPLCVERAM